MQDLTLWNAPSFHIGMITGIKMTLNKAKIVLNLYYVHSENAEFRFQ